VISPPGTPGSARCGRRCPVRQAGSLGPGVPARRSDRAPPC